MTLNSDPAVDAFDSILIKMLPKDYFSDENEKHIFNSVTRAYNRNTIGKAGLKSPVTFDTFMQWHQDCLKRISAADNYDLFIELKCSIRQYIKYFTYNQKGKSIG